MAKRHEQTIHRKTYINGSQTYETMFDFIKETTVISFRIYQFGKNSEVGQCTLFPWLWARMLSCIFADGTKWINLMWRQIWQYLVKRHIISLRIYPEEMSPQRQNNICTRFSTNSSTVCSTARQFLLGFVSETQRQEGRREKGLASCFQSQSGRLSSTTAVPPDSRFRWCSQLQRLGTFLAEVPTPV